LFKEIIMGSIYGILSAIDDDTRPKSVRKSIKLKPANKRVSSPLLTPKRVNPDLKYNTAKSASPDGVEYMNSVSIPIELLKNMTDKAQLKGRRLADVMLRSSITSVMGLSSAIDYSTAVLVDGFGIRPEDIATSEEITSVLNNICSLEVVYKLLKGSNLSKNTKRKFLRIMTEKLAEGSASKLLSNDKKKSISDSVKNGMITSRRQPIEDKSKEVKPTHKSRR
jgi:hypothetical protein